MSYKGRNTKHKNCQKSMVSETCQRQTDRQTTTGSCQSASWRLNPHSENL